jgi:hypothetical protein
MSADRDLARIRLVTCRYAELRGLVIAALASAVLLSVWSLRAWLGPAATWWGLVPGAALGGTLAWRLERRYDAKFGRVRQCARDSRFQRAMPFVIGALTFLDSGLRGHGYPSALFLVLAAGQAWVAVRDWPWRSYYLVAAAFTASGAALYSRVTGPDRTHDEWILAVMTLTGTGAALAGLLDHHLLARTLRPRSDNAAEETRVESA